MTGTPPPASTSTPQPGGERREMTAAEWHGRKCCRIRPCSYSRRDGWLLRLLKFLQVTSLGEFCFFLEKNPETAIEKHKSI